MGAVRVKRGDIRWYTFRAPDKRRPVLVLTRSEVIDHRIGAALCTLPATRWPEVRRALLTACGFGEQEAG